MSGATRFADSLADDAVKRNFPSTTDIRFNTECFYTDSDVDIDAYADERDKHNEDEEFFSSIASDLHADFPSSDDDFGFDYFRSDNTRLGSDQTSNSSPSLSTRLNSISRL